ncbi:MAG TPA: M24 family metallopeptidase [Thermoanaerobaculia bacterium]|nr:M24 family metallopeptidase [Thermoanaerobaculia bacterium]
MGRRLLPLLMFLGTAFAAASDPPPRGSPFGGPSPWPAIRKERVTKLLPEAMRRAGVDAWVVVCRENDNDPLALHVGGENAGGAAAFLFLLGNAGVRVVALSPVGEATALKDVGLHDEVVVLERGTSVWDEAAKRLRAAAPKKIAVNSSSLTVADGLSHTQRGQLEKALGPDLAARLVPSEELVVEWLSVKLPQEVEILRRAAALTAALELEAYGTVVPGVTSDADVARFLKRRMRELGVEDAWAPDQNPNVNSGPDRGHSHATDRVIRAGDFIQTDFGIKVHGVWCTDVQRFAYVLAPGETRPPADALKKWEIARKGSRVALAAMKPGIRGYDVDKAQRDWMKEMRSEWVMWGTGHPVGYWAHDVGPGLSGAQREGPPSGSTVRTLRPGQTFAFDGFFSWKLPEGGTKTISVEEMAVVTPTGAQYLIPPQEDLVLIRSAK